MGRRAGIVLLVMPNHQPRISPAGVDCGRVLVPKRVLFIIVYWKVLFIGIKYAVRLCNARLRR